MEETCTSNDMTGRSSAIMGQYEGMLDEYRAIANTVGKKLIALQGLTETAFIKIGENLPEINAALRTTGNEANNLSDYFKVESGLVKGADSENNGDLNRLRNAADYLLKIVSDQGSAFQKMSEMMRRIEALKASIESIRDFAAEIEMLSLNAAIVAIKAGDAGRTLNPITVELKKMANIAIALIDDIVNTSEKLAEKYNLFQEISEQKATLCQSDVENIGSNLTHKHNGLKKSIIGLVGQLDRVNDAVGNSLQNISEIMNELQVQDIITQCTDHVRVSLEQASKESDFLQAGEDNGLSSPEHLLSTISFQENVPRLCTQLLDDIDIRLDSTVRAIEDKFKQIQVLFCASDTNIIGCAEASSTDEYLKDVEVSFQDVEDVVIGTATMIQNAANSWEQLWSTAVGLSEMLGILEKQFKHLKKVTNFHMINIPIKIEVARSSGLAKDGELASRVEGLADYISTEMKESHRAVSQDHQFLTQLVESMARHKSSIEMNLESIAGDIDDLLGNFCRAKTQVKSTFSLLSEHVLRLQDLITTTLADLEQVHILVVQNRELKEKFQELAAMACKTKAIVASESDCDDVEAKDGRLRNVIEKFTVLAHKKIASEMYDVDIEHGDREGELILF